MMIPLRRLPEGETGTVLNLPIYFRLSLLSKLLTGNGRRSISRYFFVFSFFGLTVLETKFLKEVGLDVLYIYIYLIIDLKFYDSLIWLKIRVRTSFDLLRIWF